MTRLDAYQSDAVVRAIEDELTAARDRLWRETFPVEAWLLGDFSEIDGPFRFREPAPSPDRLTGHGRDGGPK